MKYDIYLEGTVGWAISSGYVRYMLDKYKDQHVNIRLSSLGGDVVTALNIYSMFKEHGDVTVYLVGAAASAATIIACGAKQVKIDSACMFLVHKCSSYVDAWGSYNEEEIGTLIGKLTKKQEDQKVIDGIIANIYSMRNGKSIEDNIAIMSKSAWLNAEKAKEYGLVDEVYEIKDGAEKNLSNQFRNSIENNKGVEKPLDVAAMESVADADGEPTESFLQKTLQKISSLFQCGGQMKSNCQMLKIFAIINAILGVDGLEEHEDKVVMTQDQVKQIEGEITNLRNQVDANESKVSDLNNQITDLQNQVTEKDNTISGLNDKISKLEDAPGDETDDLKSDGNGDYDAIAAGRELYDSIKDC
ncbi:MAG: ATP-dependent Clp protease proteolytic subunit [Bacteroidaceae bacterium]|nr:ATP-dependent Clp protease proteolytic subunit [Bacteroidaceae bacterium]